MLPWAGFELRLTESESEPSAIRPAARVSGAFQIRNSQMSKIPGIPETLKFTDGRTISPAILDWIF